MRSRIICAAIAAAALAVPGTAMASSGVTEYVVGAGQVLGADGVLNHFSVAAKSSPRGDSGIFHAFVTKSDAPLGERIEILGTVTCLNVVGDRAVMFVRPLKTKGVTAPQSVRVTVVDGDPTNTPDRISFVYVNAPAPTVCPADPPTGAEGFLERGSIKTMTD